jgi:hypothetical protein
MGLIYFLYLTFFISPSSEKVHNIGAAEKVPYFNFHKSWHIKTTLVLNKTNYLRNKFNKLDVL